MDLAQVIFTVLGAVTSGALGVAMRMLFAELKRVGEGVSEVRQLLIQHLQDHIRGTK